MAGDRVLGDPAQLRGVWDEPAAVGVAGGLLKLARVLGDQVSSADTFLIEDVEECRLAIERAVRAVEVRGMETLIMRLPKGAAKMQRGR